MKKIFITSVLLLGVLLSYSQVPNGFNYQVVLRNSGGDLISDQSVDVEISIRDILTDGTILYTETHTKTTNSYGLVNLVIGTGTPDLGIFEDINWAVNDKFIQVKVDAGSGLTDMGAYQLLSVPFAMHAASATNLGSENVYTGTDTLFVVKDAEGNPVFVVFPDGAKVIIEEATKGNVGGFAVSGRSPTKAEETEIFHVTPDSTRVFINDTIQSKGSVGGFAVSGRSPTKGNDNDYFNISGNASTEIIDPGEPRILWYPNKEAFLVGRVLVESPDSVGTNSFVTGYESKAIGNYSQALGYSSIARGNYSTAIGNQSVAGVDSTTLNAFAFGNKAYALDTNTIAIGRQAVASSKNAVAIGDSAIANGANAIAFGSSFIDFYFHNGEVGETLNTAGPVASGDNSLAIGSGVVASAEGAVVIGALDTASAGFTTVFGLRNQATAFAAAVGSGEVNRAMGKHSIVSGGRNNDTSGDRSTIGGGEGNDATGDNATIAGGTFNNATGNTSAIPGGQGNTASGNNSYASGYYSTASGNYSSTVGAYWSEANDFMETVIGPMAVASTGNQTAWVSTDRLLTIGNGTMSPFEYSNAMVILKNGNTGIGISDPGSYKLYVNGGNAYFSGEISAETVTDRTPYPKDLEIAYKAVLSMKRLPDGEYEEGNKENQLDHSQLHPFVQSSDGEHRDLSATVSAQNEVIKDLIKQNQELKVRLAKIEKLLLQK